MKGFTKILLGAAIAIAFFFIGRCGRASSDNVTTETTTTTKTDTLWRDRVITVDPIPAPTQVKTTTVYVPTLDPKQSAELAKLKSERDYFQKVVAERERVIAALEAGEAGVGEPVGEDAPTNQIAPNESLVFENQTINLYNFDEKDSLTGIRLTGSIGVLGFLAENPPPQFGLIYPSSFTWNTTNSQPIKDATKNRALGISLAFRNDFTGKSTYQTGTRLHYRKNGFLLGGGLWGGVKALKTPVAAEAFIGAEIGWRK